MDQAFSKDDLTLFETSMILSKEDEGLCNVITTVAKSCFVERCFNQIHVNGLGVKLLNKIKDLLNENPQGISTDKVYEATSKVINEFFEKTTQYINPELLDKYINNFAELLADKLQITES